MGRLSKKEEQFCHYLANTNNRIKALLKAGYCQEIAAQATNREFTPSETQKLHRQAYKVMLKPEVKQLVNDLIDARLEYLNEHGVATELEVLKALTDIAIDDNSDNAFARKVQVSALKELLQYYKDRNKLRQDNKTSEPIGEIKKFMVEYEVGKNDNKAK